VDHAGGPAVDEPEALSGDDVTVLDGQRLGVRDELVPGGRRMVDARLLEQPLVVVEGVGVDLVGVAIEHVVHRRARDGAGGPVGGDVRELWLGHRCHDARLDEVRQPQVVDARDGRPARAGGLGGEGREQVPERDRAELDGDVGVLLRVRLADGIEHGDLVRPPVGEIRDGHGSRRRRLAHGRGHARERRGDQAHEPDRPVAKLAHRSSS